jgi:hypothetical protein
MLSVLVMLAIAVAISVLGPMFVPGIVAQQGVEYDLKKADYIKWGKLGARIAGALVAIFAILSTSFIIIDSDQVGHLKRIYGGGSMPPGQVIAYNGENGPQARVLSPGFHFELLLNVMYEVEELHLIEIPEGRYGLVTAKDGMPLKEGQYLAAGWPEDKFSDMQNAEFFLKNGGQKGTQLSVIRPGKYRLNNYLFEIKIEDATSINTGEVGVIKSNVQEIKNCSPVEIAQEGSLSVPLVPKGCIGVWNEPLYPGMYYLNKRAYNITKISTLVQAWEYVGGYTKRHIDLIVDQRGTITQKESEEKIPVLAGAADTAITVRVEGWQIPLDLRVLVQVDPKNAPFVVASVGGLQQIEDKILTPAIRSILRNVTSAEGRKVFDLQDKRSELEEIVEQKIRPEGQKAGISIKEVRFGDPVIPPELLTARQREQLAGQLKKAYEQEKIAQDERIKSEKSRSEADQQPNPVKAQMEVKIAEQKKLALQKQGEGEKLELMEIAAGQKKQVDVLGKDRVMQLSVLEKILEAAKEQPDIVKVPNVYVQGEGGFEGAAAILGASNLLQGMKKPAPKKK